MCGIAGILGNYNKEQLTSMLETQQHRGPDATGTYFDDYIALGHNRLSIIDLSNDANQPFYSSDDRYVLVFNGELYNYLELKSDIEDRFEFKTKSDTEVLLAYYSIYKEECLEYFNGMFSFAIWDKKEKVIFAARDRFGVKPFYYSLNSQRFSFGSEIKTLVASGIKKSPNFETWSNYLCYGSYGLPNETFWEDISQLPAGHFLKVGVDLSIQIEKWYNFESNVFNNSYDYSSYQATKTQYLDLLKNSIKLRFRSDVGVGFNLSGGLDSSALLALVSLEKRDEKIKAFTFYTGDNNYDELPWVEEMVKITNNPLEKVKLNVHEVPDLLQHVSYNQDEPYGGIPTLAYSKIFNAARSEGIKVLLDGQGMDEQLAGYDYYHKVGDHTIQGVTRSPFRKNVLSNDILSLANKNSYPQPFDDRIKNMQFRDLFFTKIPRALRFNDRVSMMHGTELREPFLDYQLVEFAFSMPIEYKINNSLTKYILRDIVSEYLSENISYSPKRPLQTPQREWIGNELYNDVENLIDLLLNSDFSNVFKSDEVWREWKNYKDGDRDSSFHIWQWINMASLLIA